MRSESSPKKNKIPALGMSHNKGYFYSFDYEFSDFWYFFGFVSWQSQYPLKPFNNPKSETDEKDNRAAKDWVRLFHPRNPPADLRSVRTCAKLWLRYD
jgi:hypothetical protein